MSGRSGERPRRGARGAADRGEAPERGEEATIDEVPGREEGAAPQAAREGEDEASRGSGGGGEAASELSAAPVAPPVGLVRRAVTALVPRRLNLRGTVYLLLDHSTSMADPGKMPELRRGAIRFFHEAVGRSYAVGALGFADRATLVSGAGLNAHRFWGRLMRLRPYGRTSMAAGLRAALVRLSWRRGRRVIVLITDGMPDDRAATLEAARLARARGVTLIAIGTGDADHDFLAALTGRPELARHATRAALAGAIEAAARDLATG